MWDDVGALRRLTKWLVGLLLLLLLATGVAWVYHSNYFPIKQVSIQGKLVYADNRELQSVAQKYLRGNILRADVNSAQEAFAQLPWVDSVTVRRRLPDTVEILLTERVPIARWKNSGLVDSKGNVFQANIAGSLPMFEGQSGTGKDMVKYYHEFSAILKKQHLAIKELAYTSRSAWLVVLDNGITVRLGRENEITRLQLFSELWPNLLKKHQDRLVYVDMRYKDGFSVRYRQPEEKPSESSD